MSKHDESKLRNAGRQFLAGGSAGLVEICLLHPLDVIKTRFQLQSNVNKEYSSLIHCFRTMYAKEGLFAFYRGILPPIIAETPKRATKFLTFEQYRSLICHLNFTSSAPLIFSIAGLGTGFTEAFVANPFEVVKVRLQADKSLNQTSAFAMARRIYSQHGFGLNGLNKGLTSTLLRHGIFNMVYFGVYHSLKPHLPHTNNKKVDLFQRFCLGFSAGLLACCVNIPFDVAKSRIQGPVVYNENGTIKYKSCIQTVQLVRVEEGFRALYKGLVPKIMRLAPGGGIMLIVFEAMYKFLQEHF